MPRNSLTWTESALLSCVGFLIVTLLGGNLYFIKRLVDKIESTQEITWQLRQEVAILKITTEQLQKKGI